MNEDNFDYDPKKDKLSTTVTIWIIILSVGLAIYLATILV